MASSEDDARAANHRVDHLTALLEQILAYASSVLWLAQHKSMTAIIRALLPRRGDTPSTWPDRARTRLWTAITGPLAAINRDMTKLISALDQAWQAAHTASSVGGDVASRQLVQQLAGTWHTGMRGLTSEAQAAIGRETAQLLNGDQTLDAATRRAARGMLDSGVHVIRDSSGKRWQPASYAEMMLRTAAQRAHTATVLTAARELDTPYVQVSDHHRECERCRPFESRILRIDGITDQTASVTLDEARAAGLFHPHCRHQIHPWWPQWDALPPPGEPDPALYRASQTQRRMERGIRDAQLRLEIEQTIQPASPQASAARGLLSKRQAALRAYLTDQPRLKRSPRRELPRPGDTVKSTAGMTE